MSNTAPYSEQAARAVTESVQHMWYAEIVHPDLADPIPLDVIDASVSFSEDTSPYARADLSCAIPDIETLDLIDPRSGLRVAIYAGYWYPGGEIDVHALAGLELRSRMIRRGGGDMILECAGYEKSAMDVLLTSPIYARPTDEAGPFIESLLRNYDRYTAANSFKFNNQLPSRPVTPDDEFNELLSEGRGDNLWDVIQTVCDGANAWVYHDGLDTWHIREVPNDFGEVRHTLSTGEGGTITNSDALLTLEGFANSVVYKFSNDNIGAAEVLNGPYGVRKTGRKQALIESGAEGTPEAATRAARAIVRRMVSRGRRVGVESAGAAYWLRPGDTIRVQLETGAASHQLISSIQLSHMGNMNITTRVPEDIIINDNYGE